MKGVSHKVNLIDAEPGPELAAVYAVMIRALRDLPYEHIIFEFQDCDARGNTGLIFLQMCRDGKQLHVEVRADEPDFTMYATKLTDEETISILREAIRTRKAPDVTGWADITEKVRSEKK